MNILRTYVPKGDSEAIIHLVQYGPRSAHAMVWYAVVNSEKYQISPQVASPELADALWNVYKENTDRIIESAATLG